MSKLFLLFARLVSDHKFNIGSCFFLRFQINITEILHQWVLVATFELYTIQNTGFYNINLSVLSLNLFLQLWALRTCYTNGQFCCPYYTAAITFTILQMNKKNEFEKLLKHIIWIYYEDIYFDTLRQILWY